MAPQIHQGQIAGTHWDPRQYIKFSDYRLRPARALLDRIPLTSPTVIFDLGCGSGEVTRIIAERWPSATVYGIDNSEEMLAQAAAEPSEIRWINSDIRELSARRYSDGSYMTELMVTRASVCSVKPYCFVAFAFCQRSTSRRVSRSFLPS